MGIHNTNGTLSLEKKYHLKYSGLFLTCLLNSSAISSLPLYIKLIVNTFLYVNPLTYSQPSETDVTCGMLRFSIPCEQLADVLRGISIIATKQGKAHLPAIKAQYKSDCEDYQPIVWSKPRESVGLSCQKNKNLFPTSVRSFWNSKGLLSNPDLSCVVKLPRNRYSSKMNWNLYLS